MIQRYNESGPRYSQNKFFLGRHDRTDAEVTDVISHLLVATALLSLQKHFLCGL